MAHRQTRKSKDKKTIEFGEEVFLDLDINGNPVGIEISDIARPQRMELFHKITRKYHIPGLNKFHPNALQKIFA